MASKLLMSDFEYPEEGVTARSFYIEEAGFIGVKSWPSGDLSVCSIDFFDEPDNTGFIVAQNKSFDLRNDRAARELASKAIEFSR